MVTRLSTAVTPGADHATRSASSRSIHERTVPLRTTLPPLTSTLRFWASVSTLRTSASSICRRSSGTDGCTRGRTVMRLLTPRTPDSRRTDRSAARRWNSHSTSPLSVTQPLDTVTSIFSMGTSASHSSARVAAAAMSESLRSAALGRRTSMSFATARTPRTRCAARSAPHFLAKLSTQPVSVTTPSLTATPISLGWTRASHLISCACLRPGFALVAGRVRVCDAGAGAVDDRRVG